MPESRLIVIGAFGTMRIGKQRKHQDPNVFEQENGTSMLVETEKGRTSFEKDGQDYRYGKQENKMAVFDV